MFEDDDLFSVPDPVREAPLFSVSDLLGQLNAVMAGTFGQVRVIGEVHAFKPAASGHWYIDLKDEHRDAVLQLCFFRQKRFAQTYIPKVGDLVQVRGNLNIYMPRGQLSLNVSSMEPAGDGVLYAQFMALKAKLEAVGLFDAARKKPIPLYPKRVGVVTSLAGAALRDVVKTISLHAPNIELIVYPTPVQGIEAESQVIRALHDADAQNLVDCILLVRGGGSLTDLWTFNGEALARAIAGMHLPVVSGIGHETDTTIADFVADLRAATPTAAALSVASGWENGREKFSGLCKRLGAAKEAKLRLAEQMLKGRANPRRALEAILDNLGRRSDEAHHGLESAVLTLFNEKARRAQELTDRLLRAKPSVRESSEQLVHVLTRFENARVGILQQRTHCVDLLKVRLNGVRPNFSQAQGRLDVAKKRLNLAYSRLAETRLARLSALKDRLQSVDVKRVLERGFCLVQDENGRLRSRAGELAVGQGVDLYFSDGNAFARVEKTALKK